MTLQFNPILATDSYKLSHAPLYPDNVQGMYSYIEPRVGSSVTIIPFGLQMWVEKFLSVQITEAHILEAAAFAAKHGEPFDPAPWRIIVDEYEGYWPVTIYAVPEGLPVPGGNVLASIQCTDPRLFWLTSYLETALLRAIWYPTTIATADYEVKKDIAHLYRVGGADLAGVAFALHDFGGRGVTSAEQAEIGGAAHLVNFMGSDTIEGIRAANYYYSDEMAGFSVPATEHSIECSFGSSPDEELKYLRQVLKVYGKPGTIVSVVIDGYDVYRAARTLCTVLRDEIIASGAKVVFRPDSGDMFEVVPRILDMQAEAFGFTINSKGYKEIKHVGLIQGDGVDRANIKNLLGLIMSKGYSPNCMIFGSGGGLLQKVNRDTLKFAQKASAILVDTIGEGQIWNGISKNPITDPGKKSKEGRVTLVRSLVNGEYSTVDIDKNVDVEFKQVMQVVYSYGDIYNKTTLAEVRARCAI